MEPILKRKVFLVSIFNIYFFPVLVLSSLFNLFFLLLFLNLNLGQILDDRLEVLTEIVELSIFKLISSVHETVSLIHHVLLASS